jgi:hypothetical protein
MQTPLLGLFLPYWEADLRHTFLQIPDILSPR